MKKPGRPGFEFTMSRRQGLIAGSFFLAIPRFAGALTVQDKLEGNPIYIGHAIVTGTDNRDRPRGLGLCLGEVLIKASGDPNILLAPGFAAMRGQAASMVVAISYHDRMSALPKHDEQGTRDRPFDLTALFDEVKIATALRQLGGSVWTGRRPTVFLTANVRAYSGHSFTLLAGPSIGYDQQPLMRASIADASVVTALPVGLPPAIGSPPPAGSFPVQGSLVWSDAALGWIASWQASAHGRTVKWGERGQSFDQAYENALLGALGILSGHHPPRPVPS
jgi:hypothetical protein